jgi:hypothetical protein
MNVYASISKQLTDAILEARRERDGLRCLSRRSKLQSYFFAADATRALVGASQCAASGLTQHYVPTTIPELVYFRIAHPAPLNPDVIQSRIEAGRPPLSTQEQKFHINRVQNMAREMACALHDPGTQATLGIDLASGRYLHSITRGRSGTEMLTDLLQRDIHFTDTDRAGRYVVRDNLPPRLEKLKIEKRRERASGADRDAPSIQVSDKKQ